MAPMKRRETCNASGEMHVGYASDRSTTVTLQTDACDPSTGVAHGSRAHRARRQRVQWRGDVQPAGRGRPSDAD